MKKEYDFSKGKRGPVVRTPSSKKRITIRLDEDILAWFRREANAAGGGSYQRMINEALRGLVESERDPLEEKVRRVVREELAEYGSKPQKPSSRE